MIKQEDCVIIIPHLGTTPEQEYALDQCLPSLKETCNIRIIVVKNGPDCKHQGDIRIFNYQGQCAAVNVGIAATNTPWIFICQDDMIYAPGWFDKLVAPIDNEILCISPQLVEPRKGAPSFIEYFCGGAGGDFDKSKWLEFAKNYNPMTQDPTNIMPKALCRNGFNFPLLVKRETFDLVGGYDIQYDPWSATSDTDLQCKFELAGAKTYQNTNCIVYHFSQTSGTFEPRNQGDWSKNYAYFQDKWGFERPGDPDVWFSKDLIKYDQLKYKPWWKDFYKKATSENKTELP